MGGDRPWIVLSGDCSFDVGGECIRSPNFPENYGNNEACEIGVNPSRWTSSSLVANSFDTEARWDTLTVNGQRYCGSTVTFNGVVPTRSILWTSDGSVVRSGWSICRDMGGSPTTIATTTTSTAITTTTSTTTSPMFGDRPWIVLSGDCSFDVGGECIRSPNFPENYGNNEACEIGVNPSRWTSSSLVANSFDTEARWDTLTVNGQRYSGSTVTFNGVVPTRSILWTSDGSVVRSGWSICMRTTFTTTPSSAPWMVLSGNCNLDASAECVTSPNYPQVYANNDACEIGVNSSQWPSHGLRVHSFATESDYDFLTVNGVRYSGRSPALTGIAPTQSIYWTSDNSVERRGWSICRDVVEITTNPA